MLWNTPAEPPIAVVRDLGLAREALARALEQADSTTRPGLQEALTVLDRLHISEEELVGDWARRTLASAGVDPVTEEVKAIAALRAALPGMNLRAATKLAERAKPAAHVG